MECDNSSTSAEVSGTLEVDQCGSDVLSSPPSAKRIKLDIDIDNVPLYEPIPWTTDDFNLYLVMRNADDSGLVKLPVHTYQLYFTPYFETALSKKWTNNNNNNNNTAIHSLDLSDSDWNIADWIIVIDCCYKIAVLSGYVKKDLQLLFWKRMWKYASQSELKPSAFHLGCYIMSISFDDVWDNCSIAPSFEIVVDLFVRVSQTPELGHWDFKWLKTVLNLSGDIEHVSCLLAKKCLEAITWSLSSTDKTSLVEKLPPGFTGPMEILIICCGLTPTHVSSFWEIVIDHVCDQSFVSLGDTNHVKDFCQLDDALSTLTMFLPCYLHSHSASEEPESHEGSLNDSCTKDWRVRADHWREKLFAGTECVHAISHKNHMPPFLHRRPFRWGRIYFSIKFAATYPSHNGLITFANLDKQEESFLDLGKFFTICRRNNDQKYDAHYIVHCSSYFLQWI